MGIIFKIVEICKMKHLQQREPLEGLKLGNYMITHTSCFKKIALAAVWRMDYWGKSGSLEAGWKSMAVVLKRDNGGRDWSGGDG